jgi:hypothetical protein
MVVANCYFSKAVHDVALSYVMRTRALRWKARRIIALDRKVKCRKQFVVIGREANKVRVRNGVMN